MIAVVLSGGCFVGPMETDADFDSDADGDVEAGGPIAYVCDEGTSVCRCHDDLPGLSFVMHCDDGTMRITESCPAGFACANLSLDPPRAECVELMIGEVHPCD